MSKGRVWNKGKRNGGGGPPKDAASKAGADVKKSSSSQVGGTIAADNNIVDPNNPINRVARMNRENWVVRQAPVKRDQEKG
jgi:hypothetical protein